MAIPTRPEPPRINTRDPAISMSLWLLRGCFGVPEVLQLQRAQAAPAAGSQVTQLDGAEAPSHEPLNGVADLLHHAANLAFAALAKDKLDQKEVIANLLQELRRYRAGKPVFEADSGFEPLKRARIWLAVDLDEILLGRPVPRVKEAIGRISVIGEEKQAFALAVQPTHVKEMVELRREEMIDSSSAARVVARGYIAARLVECDPLDLVEVHTPAVDLHLVQSGGDALAELGGAPVHGDPALADEVLATTARRPVSY